MANTIKNLKLQIHKKHFCFEAKLKIGNTLLIGNVELHCKTSEWNTHKHSADKNYANVIAHIVWENDCTLPNNLPTIILQDRVSKILLEKIISPDFKS